MNHGHGLSYGTDYPDPLADQPDAGDVDRQHRGQLRIAYRLADQHAERLLHVAGLGWHVWSGARWEPDKRGGAKQAVFATLKNALAEAANLDADERDRLYRDVRKCESAPGVDGVLTLAQAMPQLAATVDDLDPDPYLLNCTNGTLDLRDLTLRPHDSRDRITKTTGCAYDPQATGATFESFVVEVLPNDAVRGYVQRIFGLSLAGRVLEHLLPIYTGTGANGKSTLLNVARLALGDYCIEAEPDLFLTRDRTAHPTGQADLLGVRLAVVQETDEGRRMAVSTVKKLTGGDPVKARRMRQDFFEFTPSHTAILVTNHKPKVPGDDPALWRRLRVVPFDVVIPADRRDPRLPDRLALDVEAVLSWAVDGWRDYQTRGLDDPDEVSRATQAYRADSDVIARFIDERCLINPHLYVRAQELFDAYTSWCAHQGESSVTAAEFKSALEARELTQKRGSAGMRWTGIGLLTEEGV